MKKIILLVLFTIHCSPFTIHAQSGNWIWGRAATGAGSGQEGMNVTTDPSGNVIATGEYYSTTTFGTTTCTNAGNGDVYVVKYSPSGAVLWAQHAGGSNGDWGSDVATDEFGNIYVTGAFVSPTITFGTITLTNSGGGDAFLVKYSPSGTVLWATHPTGSSSEQGNSVATDAQGNVFITGKFLSPALTFGATTITNSSFGGNDIFTAAYNTTTGAALWAKSAGGGGDDSGDGISADALGNVYVTGTYWDSTIVVGTTTLPNAGWGDMFIAKYSSTGAFLWAHSAGGTQEDYGTSVATDASGNVYATGYFTSLSIVFGSYTFSGFGGYSMFVVKYNSSGTVLLAKKVDGGKALAMAALPASSGVYITGSIAGSSITFDTITVHYPAISNDDIFIVKYDAGLNAICASSFGSGGDDEVGIAADGSGNAYVSGDFGGHPYYTIASDTLTLTGPSTETFFVAKYSCNGSSGIDEIIDGETIILFPNPTTGAFTVESKNKIESIKVFNVLGECVLTPPPYFQGGGRGVVDASGIAKGIYFVEVVSTGSTTNVVRKKIAVQ